MKQFIAALACMISVSAASAGDLRPDAKVAFLGLGFVDLSTEGAYNGARADETARLALIERLVEQSFLEKGLLLVDLAPIEDKLANIANPGQCYGCDVRFGRALDADYVVVGAVHKISNLIISMNLFVRDVRTGETLRAKAVDVRSNTDRSWQRGMTYILKNGVFQD
ncbi:MAG: DUF3280 domain-containing protein [Roseibium sp.]|uniref:DUF3280 domain-containing protein n=1 Tax=Roseibium sp. TaxID=1936156 RepID=UPI003D9C2687